MSLASARSFLLGSYHDLPNVLFIGSLLLGGITGYLPLVWLSLGMILNGTAVAAVQLLLRILFPTWSQVSVPAGMGVCSVIPLNPLTSSNDILTVAPSHWLSAALFFATFSIFNSIQVAIRPSAEDVDGNKVSTRRAVSLSAMVVGIVFFALVLARGFSGCETWLGGALGALIGMGTAIGYWYLLDLCGTGTIPDILQIVKASAPAGSAKNTPVICS
jgi:hypothetical protein